MRSELYESDLNDDQWFLLAPLLEAASKKKSGRPRHADRREIVNAIFYIPKTGYQWRQLPREFPTWSTVYVYYRRWRLSGVWFQACGKVPTKSCIVKCGNRSAKRLHPRRL